MESFSNHTRQHRGHDVNPSAGRRGTFKNRTWVSGDRSGSSSPFQAGHLGGADAMRWERGGGIRGGGGGLGRGRGRGKGRSPRPDFGSLPRTEDVSEVEDETTDVGVIVVAAADGAEVGPGDEPVLETREEREQFYQEVCPSSHIHPRSSLEGIFFFFYFIILGALPFSIFFFFFFFFL
ncbi:hypothetical protein B0F90DRAFT_1340408 [Multifurca ochricompacta]|uniref:Uncharacterized protein n=1 Tax=Multifurca ochricompacta TaxID=376703 RepID=A0AAD4LY53_9AGAM|nr:hypothetical protein B0F90DRAFT_1340408 [Multifurca ochricompacta]